MADELYISATLDASDLISGMQNLASSIESNMAKISAAFGQIGTKSAEQAAQLEEYFNIARSNVATAIQPLIAAQLEYTTASTQLEASQTSLIAAQQQEASALQLVESLQTKGTSSGNELVVAQQLLMESGIRVSQTIQQVGTALDRASTAHRELAQAEGVAFQRAAEFVSVQNEVISQSAALASSAASSAAGEAELSTSLAGVSQQTATLAELQLYLTGANLRLAQATTELKAAETGLNPGEVTAAFMERQAAVEGVEVAESNLQAKVTSLRTALAEEKAIIANANVSWVEYNAAKETAAAITAELNSVQGTANTTTQASATAQTEYNAVSQQTAAVIQLVSTWLERMGSINQGVAASLSMLAKESATNTSTAQSFEAAINKVNAALERYGGQLKITAEGLDLVDISTKKASASTQQLNPGIMDTTNKFNAMGSMMAYIGGRASALALGMGQLGFALGILGRSSATLVPIFTALFYVAVPVILFEAISGLVEKFREMEEKVRKSQVALQDFAETQYAAADAAEVENLKLEDEINKLEGRPAKNGMKIALLENKIAAEQLNKALSDALEKYLELLKAADVSFIDKLLTGKQGTSGIASAIEESRIALQAAMAWKSAALAQGNEEEIKRANESIQINREWLQRTLDQEKSTMEEKKRIRLLELEEGIPAIGRSPGVKGLSPEKAAVEVNQAYQSQNLALAAGNALIAESVAREGELVRKSEDNLTIHKDTISVDAAKRERTITEPDIRTMENTARLRGQADKAAADEAFRQAEVDIKKRIDAEVRAGESKAQAVLDTLPLYEAALQSHSDALQRSLGVQHDLMVDALQAQIALDQRMAPGPEKEAQLKRSNEALRVEDENYQRERLSLISAGKVAEEKAEEEGNEKAIEARDAYYRKLIDLDREATRTAVANARDRVSQAETEASKGAEVELRIIQAKETLHLLTAQQGLQQRVAVLNEERTAIESAVNEQIAVLQRLRDQVAANWQEMVAGGAAEAEIKRVREQWEALGVDIDRLSTSLKNIDTKIDTTKMDAQLGPILAIGKSFDAIANSINRSIAGIITGHQTLLGAIRSIYAQIVDTAVNAIARIAEKWAFEHIVMLVATRVFHIQDILAHSQAAAAKSSVEKAAQANRVALQTATSTAMDATYAKDTILFSTSEAGKTSAVVTGEAARKAAAVAGQAAVTAATVGAAVAITAANTVRAESDVFVQAIESIPFPENLAAAPAAAATVKAEMAGFAIAGGAAAKGAVLQSDMPVFAHAQEMILPASISTGLQSVISTGSVGGGSEDRQESHVHVHMGDVSAMDTAGAAAVFRRSQRELGKYVQRAIRSGHIKFSPQH